MSASIRGTVIGHQAIDLPGSLSPISGSSQAYRTTIADGDLVFVPYFTVDTERYKHVLPNGGSSESGFTPRS
jgi:hypothetical protein